MTSLAMRAVAPARSARSRASRSSRADAGPKGLGTAVADRRAPLLDRRDRPGARLTARTGVVPKAAENSDGPSTNSAAAEAVAAAFVNAQVTSGMRVGVTAGAVVSCVLAEIHERVADGRLRDVVAVPADALAAKEAAVAGVPVSPFLVNDDGKLRPRAVDVLAMQPDELAVNANGDIEAVFGRRRRPTQPDLVTARGLLEEAKVVALLATHNDEKPIENHTALFANEAEPPDSFRPLGGSVPVAMRFQDKDAFEEDAEELDDLFLGDAEVWRRGAELDANPRGGKNPYVSPCGTQTIVDLCFNDPLAKPPSRWDAGFVLFGEPASASRVAAELASLDGVAAHGIVLGADAAYVGETAADGVVTARKISRG